MSNEKFSAKKSFSVLFDDGTAREILKGGNTSVKVEVGSVLGKTVYAFAVDGALGNGCFEKIGKVYDLSYKTGNPIVGIYGCSGVSVAEGMEGAKALAELGKKSSALSGVVPQVSVILGNIVGSLSAIASMADLVIKTELSEFKMSSDTFGTDNVLSAAITEKTEEDAVETAKTVIDRLPSNNLSATDLFEYEDKAVAGKNAEEIAASISDNGGETLLYKEAKGYISLSTVKGVPAMVIALGKELSGCFIKAATKAVSLADAYSLPVITVIDNEKICSSDMNDITSLWKAFSGATTVKINIVSGTAFGAVLTGYVLGNADVVMALPGAVISPASASACAYALYSAEMNGKTEDEALKTITDKYISEYATAEKALENGAISEIVELSDIKETVLTYLGVLSTKKESTLPKKHSI